MTSISGPEDPEYLRYRSGMVCFAVDELMQVSAGDDEVKIQDEPCPIKIDCQYPGQFGHHTRVDNGLSRRSKASPQGFSFLFCGDVGLSAAGGMEPSTIGAQAGRCCFALSGATLICVLSF